MNISLFISNKNDKIVDILINFCIENFNIIEIFDINNIYNESKYNDKNDFYISFLNPYIIRDERIIKKGCINFHPSSPKYKGVCGASLALYNNDEYFGVTSHYIDNKIDNGNIIDVIYFKIPKNINCLELNYITKNESLKLCIKILTNIKLSNKMPKNNDTFSWGKIMMTRKKFQDWITIDLDKVKNIDEIKNKIKSCANECFDGPFLKIGEKIYNIKINNPNKIL
jgi:methionyl-tRNA formyltransferase